MNATQKQRDFDYLTFQTRKRYEAADAADARGDHELARRLRTAGEGLNKEAAKLAGMSSQPG